MRVLAVYVCVLCGALAGSVPLFMPLMEYCEGLHTRVHVTDACDSVVDALYAVRKEMGECVAWYKDGQLYNSVGKGPPYPCRLMPGLIKDNIVALSAGSVVVELIGGGMVMSNCRLGDACAQLARYLARVERVVLQWLSTGSDEVQLYACGWSVCAQAVDTNGVIRAVMGRFVGETDAPLGGGYRCWKAMLDSWSVRGWRVHMGRLPSGVLKVTVYQVGGGGALVGC